MPRGMGRGRGAVEKPKDFGGVMKKLVKFCSRYIPVMIFALVLGAIVLMLIAIAHQSLRIAPRPRRPESEGN